MVISTRAKIIFSWKTQKFLFLPYLSNWKTKKGMHWLGPGFKIGLNENLTYAREIQENIVLVMSTLIL